MNVVPLVGHGTLRVAAMGFADRRPTAEELDVMRGLLGQALAEGAWGLSSGLDYPPGVFAEVDELVALGQMLAPARAPATTRTFAAARRRSTRRWPR